ncbi:MAG: alpha-D-ribose 1-methylphosphonate 5-triphosphate diphosphatase [Peptococcaceae bacterium]|jgi:alpha-D-ribose 1-methylphosphonate 5-triphosphate diphosphatase|nr:alpha-D-ribose 1-methylphosphonate 5-triphosphate diphosphatase [Peptococcaceae bacterium]
MIGLINGKIVGEDRVIEGAVALLDGGVIQDIAPAGAAPPGTELIDARGGYIAPGLIDIHTDYCEQIIQPRATSVMDLGLAFRQLERVLAGQGITTAYHSLSLLNGATQKIKAVRSLELVSRIASYIEEKRGDKGLIRHRLHVRVELDNPDCLNTVADWLEKGWVDEISFMDHTPGQGQYRDLAIYKESTMGYMELESEAEYEKWLGRQSGKAMLSPERVGYLIRLAQRRRIPVASHDDDTTAKIDFLVEMGIRVSEFPITLEVARYAAARDVQTVLGAPNILLGGSHSGNLSAEQAILAGAGSVLCSDYYPAGLLCGVFLLHQRNRLPLPDCFRLVSLNPARAVGIDGQYGSVTPGKKADILIIQAGEWPWITDVFTDGRRVLRCEKAG